VIHEIGPITQDWRGGSPIASSDLVILSTFVATRANSTPEAAIAVVEINAR
jgi:hypothetical protein